jgi:hypothetical protein
MREYLCLVRGIAIKLSIFIGIGRLCLRCSVSPGFVYVLNLMVMQGGNLDKEVRV